MRAFLLLCSILFATATAQAADVDGAPRPTVSPEVVAFVPHSATILSVAFSPDGALFATAGDDFTIKLWHAETGRLLRTFEGHIKAVTSIAFSFDGLRLVSGGADGTIRVWEAATNAGLLTIDKLPPKSAVYSVAFSPDGQTVVSGGNDGTAKLWNAETGQLLRTFAGHAGAVQTVAFSPKGTTLASGGADRTAKVWEVANGRLVHTLSGYPQPVTSLAHSPDGTRVLAGSQDGTVIAWDAATGRKLRTIDARPTQLRTVAYTPDGKHILTGGFPVRSQAPMRLWDAESGRFVRSFGEGSPGMSAIAVSTQYQLVSVSGTDITFWDIDRGVPQPGMRFTSGINDAVLSPDGKRIIAASADKTVEIWSTDKGELLRTLSGHTDKVNSVAVSKDSGMVISGSSDKTVRVWELESGKPLATLTGHAGNVAQVAVTADGTRALSGGDKKLIIWDVRAGKALRSIDTREAINTVAISPDGTRALSGATDRTIQLWDVASGQLIRTFEGHAARVAIVAFSPDGTRILSGSADSTMRLWDTSTGQVARIFRGHTKTVQSVAFSSDGKLIVSGSQDQLVKIWDTRTGQLQRDLDGHTGHVASAVFAPEGNRVVSASTDGTIRVWRASDGEQLVGLVGDASSRWLAFTPAGFFAASPDGDAMISVVRGFENYAMVEVYEQLYRPDLVEERLKGDPMGHYKNAVFKLNLNEILDSGPAPQIDVVDEKSEVAGNSIRVTVRLVNAGGGIGKKLLWRVNGKTSGDVEPAELRDVKPSAGHAVVLSRTFNVDASKDNEISVRAYNGRGLVAAERGITQTASGAINANIPRMFVLAIGVDKYRMDAYRLNYAVKDAKEFATALKTVGAGLFASVQTTVLTDEDVSVGRIASAIDSIAADAKPQDVFVLFLGGHGKSIEGKYYYLPQTLDFKGEQPLTEGGIGQEKWQEWLAKIDAQKTLLIFDTCDSGSAGAIIRGLDTSRQTAMEQLQYATGQNLIAASREAAQEGYKDHGILTYALLETLNLAEPGPEDEVNVVRLAQNAGRRVPQITQETSGVRQIPFQKLSGSDFPIGLRRRVLAPGSSISSEPTHILVRNEILREKPSVEAAGSRELNRGFRVRLVDTVDGTWALIAREGQPLGYIPVEALVKPF